MSVAFSITAPDNPAPITGMSSLSCASRLPTRSQISSSHLPGMRVALTPASTRSASETVPSASASISIVLRSLTAHIWSSHANAALVSSRTASSPTAQREFTITEPAGIVDSF